MTAPLAKRVLVVDDHPAAREALRAVLTSEKTVRFDVTEAATGAECLRAVDGQGPFDLILLDIRLPDLDGYEVCRAIRRLDARIPIVFVTGQGELCNFQAGHSAGGDSYLVKPVNRAALRSVALLFTNLARTQASAPELQPARH